MSFLPKPKLHHPGLPKNALGFTRRRAPSGATSGESAALARRVDNGVIAPSVIGRE